MDNKRTKTFGSITLLLAHIAGLAAHYTHDAGLQEVLTRACVDEIQTKLARPYARA